MHEAAERLAQSMLYEGYALYPYTPEATKNATPTPFGIAYPQAYATRQPAAFDHVQVEVVVQAPDEAEIEAAAVFLQTTGPRHTAAERRETLEPVRLGSLLQDPLARSFVHEPGPEEGAVTGEATQADTDVLSGNVSMSAERVAEGLARVRMRVENTTPLPAEEAEAMERGAALRRSLLSCHAMLGVSGGRFISPLENEGPAGEAVQACENVNTWPVLAAPDDDAVVGAAYMLPDHPQIAPASKGNLFDNTEIEEALLLHVHVLSDSEREAINKGDPAVREMVERAEATTPEDIFALHGVMAPTPTDPSITSVPPDPSLADGIEFPEWTEPGAIPEAPPQADAPRQAPPPGPADTAGEEDVVVDGKAFKRGAKVVLRPGTDGDPYDKMMDGRSATIQRIYLDYDGKAYLGVTIDDDPMAEILNESGRYLFFFADEVEHA
ncbi:MAG: hypothetical protein H0V25_05340 [Solirubrobacterales bacterium]|nr:hypothetical protein [Solirubrobacterales bacterium]